MIFKGRNFLLTALFVTVIGSGHEVSATESEVNVYTTRQPQLIQPVFDAFTRKSGITVNVLFAKKGLIERITFEGEVSPADLFITSDIGDLSAAVKAGITQKIDDESLFEKLPASLRSQDRQWLPLTKRARVFYASKERVKVGEIKTYEDLADRRWRGRVCTRSGKHPYSLALFAAMINHKGEKYTKKWLRNVRKNLVKSPQGNDRSQVKSIWAGECDISLGNTYYMGIMQNDSSQKKWAESVRIIFPVFQGGGTHINVSGVAIAAHAPNRDDAMKLIRFFMEKDTQAIYAHKNFEYPVIDGVKLSKQVKSWGDFTPDAMSLFDIANVRSDALSLVEKIGFDK